MPPLHGHRAGLHTPVSRKDHASAGVVVTDEYTGLQQASIVRHPLFGGQLFLDGDLQISESDPAYGIAMTNPLMGLERLERVAILGGGDGGVLWQLLRSLEARRCRPEVTMVEIDARVVELCRAHLPAVCGQAFDHPDARVLTGDAFAWIAGARNLDAVIYDLTMDPVREGQSREDFVAGIVAMAARALRPGGVFSMQCCGHGHANAADRAERRRLLPVIRAAIDAHLHDRCEQEVLIPSYRDLWTFLCARKPA